MNGHFANITETLDAIYALIDYSMTRAETVSPHVFTLNKIRSLLERMENPQNAYPIIHVAGTKGKGSVCAMLAAALNGAGIKTGLYTSPHLIHFNERIQIDGKMISDRSLIEIANDIWGFIDEKEPVSAFEAMTAIAFEYFKRKNVECAVIETGLGGRLDATSAARPNLTVITSISMDHMSFLGDTIEKIAYEKAGIIYPKIPVIVSAQKKEVLDVIRRVAEEKQAPLIYVPDTFDYGSLKKDITGQRLKVMTKEGREVREFWLPLAGEHQAGNALTAISTITALTNFKCLPDKIGSCDMISGLSRVFWPCRFEKICDYPEIIVDGAHNPDSMAMLGESIDTLLPERKPSCVFGASADKALEEMLMILSPHVSRFILTRSTHPRAADPEALAKIIRNIGAAYRITQTLEEAFELVWQDKRERFIVAGSLFASGGFRELTMKKRPDLRYFGKEDEK